MGTARPRAVTHRAGLCDIRGRERESCLTSSRIAQQRERRSKRSGKQFFRFSDHDHVCCDASLRLRDLRGREISGTFVTLQSTLCALEQSVPFALSTLPSNATLARPLCFDSRILSRLCDCLPGTMPCADLMRKVRRDPKGPNSPNYPQIPQIP